MDKPKTIIINDKKYYLADDLRAFAPAFFKGCINSRSILKKVDINENNYTYGLFKKNKWKEADGTSRNYYKLALSKKWVESNIPEFNDEIEYDIKPAPPVIELCDNEKFRDSDNNIVEIEVRGEKELDKCYFKVKDITDGFGIKRLDKNIIDKRSGYEQHKDYIYFNCI